MRYLLVCILIFVALSGCAAFKAAVEHKPEVTPKKSAATTDQSTKDTVLDLSKTDKNMVSSKGNASISENDKWAMRISIAGMLILAIPLAWKTTLDHWHEHCTRQDIRKLRRSRLSK